MVTTSTPGEWTRGALSTHGTLVRIFSLIASLRYIAVSKVLSFPFSLSSSLSLSSLTRSCLPCWLRYRASWSLGMTCSKFAYTRVKVQSDPFFGWRTHL